MTKRPSLLEMLSYDSKTTDPILLYPFPHLILQPKPITQISAKSRPYLEKQRKDHCKDSKLRSKLPLAGLLEKNTWTQEDLKKWVEARRKRFPLVSTNEKRAQLKEEEMSKIEKKLRLKIMLLDEDQESRKKITKDRRYLLRTATTLRRRREQLNAKPNNEEPNPPPDERELKEDEDRENEVQQRLEEEKQKHTEKIKALSAKDIVAHLKERKSADNNLLGGFLEKQPKNFTYSYIQNTLFANLVLDDVYAERQTIIDMIRYIVENNFLQN